MFSLFIIWGQQHRQDSLRLVKRLKICIAYFFFLPHSTRPADPSYMLLSTKTWITPSTPSLFKFSIFSSSSFQNCTYFAASRFKVQRTGADFINALDLWPWNTLGNVAFETWQGTHWSWQASQGIPEFQTFHRHKSRISFKQSIFFVAWSALQFNSSDLGNWSADVSVIF